MCVCVCVCACVCVYVCVCVFNTGATYQRRPTSVCQATADVWCRWSLVGVLWANPLGNGLPKRPDDVDGVLPSSARPPNVSATMGMSSTPADRHPARCDVSLHCMDTDLHGSVFPKDQSIILRVCVPLNHSARMAL